MVMQCPDMQELRSEMFNVLDPIDDVYVKDILTEQQEVFYSLMGKHPTGVPFESIVKLWLTSSRYICKMY